MLIKILWLGIFGASVAHAWDDHQSLTTEIIQAPSAVTRSYLQAKAHVPCIAEEKETIQKIAVELQVNPEKIPVFSTNSHCDTLNLVRVIDLVQSTFVDEPDQGMDQNLPDSVDPKNDRAWMGGKTGPTSQGFRHMYFGGVEWGHPLNTFQLPLHAIGQAPDRFEKLKIASDRFFKEGNIFWAVRTLMWSIHILQDLHQPFHVTQVPAIKMLPWKTLFTGFVARSTQTMGNEHYAFEGLAKEWVNDAQTSDFQQCLSGAQAKPVENIFSVVQQTRAQAPELGAALLLLFGSQMKNPDLDLPNEKGNLDYYALVHSDGNVLGMPEVKKITCELIRQTAEHTWGELDRAFQFH